MAIVATGYVRLQVLSNALANDIKKSVQGALKDAEADLKAAGKEAGDKIAEGTAEGIKDNKDVDKESDDLGERIQENIIRGTERGFGDKLKSVFRRVFRRGSEDVEEEIQETGKRAENTGKQIIGNLKKVFSGVVQTVVGFIKGAFIYAIPSIASAAGGAIASVVSTILPALSYFGEAGASGAAIFGSALLSLVTSAGLLSFALKNSGDTMKEVGKKAEDIKEYLGVAIAETFAPGAERALDKIREAIPFIHDDLNELGAAWGRVAEGMADTLTRADNMGRISSILKTNNAFVDKFGIAMEHLTTSFLILYNAAKPFIDYVGDGLVKFSEWVETTLAAKEASGELGKTVDTMLEKWKQLWETIKDFGKGVFNIFKSVAPIAEKFGDALSNIAEKFRAWTDKPENQARMTKFFEKMWDLAGPIAGLVGDIGRELGHWLENLDTEPIKRAIQTIREDILPAISSILKQVSDAVGPEFEVVFGRIADLIKRLADDGTIGVVAEQVGDLALKASELLESDAAGWIAGVALALLPFAGAIAGVATSLGGLGGLLKTAFWGLRLASLFGFGPSGGGGGGGGGFFAGAKGLLKGGIVTWIAGEILSAASEDFSAQWDSLWSGVFEAGGKALKVTGDALSIPVGYISAYVHKALGDDDAANRDLDAANATMKRFYDFFTDLDNWQAGRSTDPNSPSGNSILDNLVVDKDTDLNKKFDDVATSVREGLKSVAGEMGLGADAVALEYGKIIDALNQTPDTPELETLKKSVASQLKGVTESFATGNEDIHGKIDALNQTLDLMVQRDPSFKPLADSIRAGLSNVEKEFSYTKIPDAFTGLMADIQTAGLAIGDPLKPVADNLFAALGELSAGIETRSPEVPAKIQGMLDLLKQIPPGSPLENVKKGIMDQLAAMGVDIYTALASVPPEVAAGAAGVEGAVGDFGTTIAGAFAQARVTAGHELASLINSFDLAHPLADTLDPAVAAVEQATKDMALALQNGSPDVQAKADALVKMLNEIPAGSPLEPLRQGILQQLQAAGVDLASLSPAIQTELAKAATAANTGTQAVVTSAGAGLGRMPSIANVPLSELNKNIAALTGELPAATVPGTTATVAAVGTGLAPVAGAATVPFGELDKNVTASTAALPAAVTPGLAATVAQVNTSLAPVPTEGVQPFDDLNKALGTATSKYPSTVNPGLTDAAGQPANKFSGVEQAGLKPWLDMSTAVISALNNMNISVARVMVAVAGIVVSSWATIGQANATGLAGVVGALQTTLAAAQASKLAQEEVVRNSVRINILLIEMVQDVIDSQRMLKTVQENASAARQAVIDAAGAASSAAASAAAAAASRASAAAATPAFAPNIVKAALGGTFSPVPGGQMTLIAEAGKAERVEPLDRHGLSARDRALIDYLSGNKAGTGTNVNVQVLIGERELVNIIDTRISESNTNLTRQALSGRRATAR